MDKKLLEKYKSLFGKDAPIPPEHMIETLIKMKEDGTLEDKLNVIKDNYDEIKEEIEDVSGEKMSPNHPFFDIDLRKKGKKK